MTSTPCPAGSGCARRRGRPCKCDLLRAAPTSAMRTPHTGFETLQEAHAVLKRDLAAARRELRAVTTAKDIEIDNLKRHVARSKTYRTAAENVARDLNDKLNSAELKHTETLVKLKAALEEGSSLRTELKSKNRRINQLIRDADRERDEILAAQQQMEGRENRAHESTAQALAAENDFRIRFDDACEELADR